MKHSTDQFSKIIYILKKFSANEEEILAEVDQLFDKNTLEDMENAINVVNDTLKHEPIFKKEGLALRQEAEDEEEDNTLEGLLPKNV